MIAYKFLREGRVAPFAAVVWPAPAEGAPGEWLQAVGGGRACDGRVHACRAQDLPEWFDAELWRVELDGDVAVDCGKLVADRGRLLERVSAWDAHAAAQFAETCALRVRDSALAVLVPGDERATLEAAATAAQLVAAADAPGLAGREARAVGYVGDTARHALGARTRPEFAPTHAAVSGFIASHAAAFAADDAAAAPRELAALGDVLARRLGLAV
jgi:hypothetical protein